MSNDILTRLRQWCDCTDHGKCFDCKTADEIERLVALVESTFDSAFKEIDPLRKENKELQDAILHFERRITELQAEVKRLETENARGL
jgi:uncharacterized coiled-coil DUF342 family protein